MKRLVTVCIALMVSVYTYAALPDIYTQQQAVEIVKQFSGKPNLVPIRIHLNADYSGSCGPLAQNTWVIGTEDGIWDVGTNSGLVLDYEMVDPVLARASDTVTRSIAQQYLAAKVARFGQGYYTEKWPGYYTRVTSRGFIDYTNICGVTVLADGTVDSFTYDERPSPDFNNAVVMTLSQAQSLAGAYVLNSLTTATSVTCEAWEPSPIITYSPAGLYLVSYVFTVNEIFPGNEPGCSYLVTVDAQTGATYHDNIAGAGNDTKGQRVDRVGTSRTVALYLNHISVGGAFYSEELIVVNERLMQSLAKTHKLSAKAGEKAFTVDGKRIALPAKVVAKAGTLYLPWQALKSLPGVKCSYDAKLNRLDVTTKPVEAKATATKVVKPTVKIVR